MKKTVLAVVATIVTVLIVGIVGVLSLNYDLTSNPHVKITSFNTTGTSSSSTIDVVNVWFVLNLTNTGAGDVEDLTVIFSANTTTENNQQLIYTNATPPYDQIAEFEIEKPCLLGDLRAGETKDFRFYWAVTADFNATTLTAALKSNEAILDQAVLTIPPLPNVKITNFICLGTWHGTALGAALDLFSLNYTNIGRTDVASLTITLNTSKTDEKDANATSDPQYNPNDFLDVYINGATYPLDDLKAGGTKTLEKTYFMFGAYKYVEPFALTATLKFNDTIIDQATIMVPISTAD
jgi:hypothetical protein